MFSSRTARGLLHRQKNNSHELFMFQLPRGNKPRLKPGQNTDGTGSATRCQSPSLQSLIILPMNTLIIILLSLYTCVCFFQKWKGELWEQLQIQGFADNFRQVYTRNVVCTLLSNLQGYLGQNHHRVNNTSFRALGTIYTTNNINQSHVPLSLIIIRAISLSWLWRNPFLGVAP